MAGDLRVKINAAIRLVRKNRNLEELEALRNGLYNALIHPVLPFIPSGVKNIVIVPDGALAFLPFDILRENRESPDFGETYCLSFSHSLWVSSLAAKNARQTYEPALGFGGALYNGGYYGTDTKGNPLPWENLESSAITAEIIKRVFAPNGEVILGREMSEARIKELSADGTLAAYGLILVSSHGYFDEQNPARSGLLFSEISGRLGETGEDGNLTAAEAAQLNLNAKAVILTACDSALGEVKSGGAVAGLPGAFMAAGAASVCASLWETFDHIAPDFYENVCRSVKRGGASFREAFYRAKDALRNDAKWAHPCYWAGFVLWE